MNVIPFPTTRFVIIWLAWCLINNMQTLKQMAEEGEGEENGQKELGNEEEGNVPLQKCNYCCFEDQHINKTSNSDAQYLFFGGAMVGIETFSINNENLNSLTYVRTVLKEFTLDLQKEDSAG